MMTCCFDYYIEIKLFSILSNFELGLPIQFVFDLRLSCTCILIAGITNTCILNNYNCFWIIMIINYLDNCKLENVLH